MDPREPRFPRIDRAAHLRRDANRLTTALDASSTLLVPVWRDKNLVTARKDEAYLPTVGEAPALVAAASEWVWLGQVGERDCFALDLSEVQDPLSLPEVGGRADLADLRWVGGRLQSEEAEILVYARGILHFHRTHRYCGSCGQKTKAGEGGHVRECAAEQLKIFPRTDPAIMALVTRGDSCVLTRQPGWPEGFFAALAGFVEPGESVEDAARREIWEEIGVRVDSVRYFRSQPWPFPASLMIGFFAETTQKTLRVDRDELEDAQWFSREQLRNPQGFYYPLAYSLAHHMIRAFADGT